MAGIIIASSSPPFGWTAAAGSTPFERRAMGLLLGILAAYSLCLVPVARGQYAALGAALNAFAVVGLFATAMLALADIFSRKLGRTRRAFGIADALWYAVAAILTGATIPIYGIFKQLVLPGRGFPLDPFLARLDAALFWGHDPWTITHALFGSVLTTAAIDSLYTAWMALMFLFPALVVALVRAPEKRMRLLLSWLLVWIVVGSAAAWLLGSAGPCFYEAAVGPHPGFHALGERLADVAAQAHAMGLPMGESNFKPMLADSFMQRRYATAGGISAMPSVHVTMAALFAIAGFQIGRRTGYVMTGLAVVIWIGSIHLGWHYATDGVVGTAMMLAIWRGSARLVRRLTLPHSHSMVPGGLDV
jgi:hypothetical protein